MPTRFPVDEAKRSAAPQEHQNLDTPPERISDIPIEALDDRVQLLPHARSRSKQTTSHSWGVAPLICALFAIVTAITVLIGWAVQSQSLITVLPNLPAMAQSTAAAFLLASAAIWLITPQEQSRQKYRLGRLLAGTIILIGLGTLVRFGLGMFGHGAIGSAPSLPADGTIHLVNHMSPNSALNFVLLGAALVLTDVRGRNDRWPSQVLCLIVALDALIALVGQLYGVTLLYGLSHYLGMAVHTAALFLILSLGLLLARPDRGFVAILLADDAAGRAGRRFMPLALIAPVMLGGISLLGQRLHSTNVVFLAYMLVVASIGLLGWLVWSNVLTLSAHVRRLQESQIRLAVAQRVAQIGSWEQDIATNHTTWSDELFRLFEMDPTGGAPSIEALRAVFHPDDVPMHIAFLEQALRDGQPYEFNIRILRRDGSIGWGHAVGRGVCDASGNVTRLYGTLMDITERILAEEQFRVLFEATSHAHLLVDEGGSIIDCNAATLSLMRCGDKAQLLGIPPSLLSPEFQPDGRRSDEKGIEMCALALKNGGHLFEWQYQAVDGYEYPVEMTLTPVTLAGKPVLLSVWHDLTERKKQEEQIRDHAVVLQYQMRELEEVNAKLEALATTDGLTGLRNHRTFQEWLAQEIIRATRYNTPLSVVLLDVDHFKGYNDTYGHPAGDEVLRQVGSIIESCTRETDMAARYGGEEFVLILPQTDSEGAAVIAERLRTAIEQAHWSKRAVTASLGVSSLTLNRNDGDSLIARADRALYESKSAGRNRVTCDGIPRYLETTLQL